MVSCADAGYWKQHCASVVRHEPKMASVGADAEEAWIGKIHWIGHL